jgi:hypothetical protein
MNRITFQGMEYKTSSVARLQLKVRLCDTTSMCRSALGTEIATSRLMTINNSRSVRKIRRAGPSRAMCRTKAECKSLVETMSSVYTLFSLQLQKGYLQWFTFLRSPFYHHLSILVN